MPPLILLNTASGDLLYRLFCHCRTALQGSCDVDIEPPDSRVRRLFHAAAPDALRACRPL